jgi:hypothetical protein
VRSLFSKLSAFRLDPSTQQATRVSADASSLATRYYSGGTYFLGIQTCI